MTAADPVSNLAGRPFPDLTLEATTGASIAIARLPGRSVVFFYPYTGRPGIPDPPDWDRIPGAHGSTPQAQAYSRLYGEFRNRDVNVFGVSLQDPEWQAELAARNNLAFPLLSDRTHALSRALELPVFQTGGTTYLKRLTLFVNGGKITWVSFPVPDPQGDAAVSLSMLAGPAA